MLPIKVQPDIDSRLINERKLGPSRRIRNIKWFAKFRAKCQVGKGQLPPFGEEERLWAKCDSQADFRCRHFNLH